MGRHGTVRPWRRRVDYLDVDPVALADVTADLELTDNPHWGYGLRRGMIALPVEDYVRIRALMTHTGAA